MKKTLCALLCAAIAICLAACGAGSGASVPDAVEGNLLKISSQAEFGAGTLEGLETLAEPADGAVSLKEGETEGSFISIEYDAAQFYRMVACWNASISDGGSVEVFARAKCGQEWTDWLSWGEFTPFARRGSTQNKSCDGARMDVDTFVCSSAAAEAVQMKAVLRRSSAEAASPVLRELTMTFSGGEMLAAYAQGAAETLPASAFCEAPAYAQGIRAGHIADSICSPTTMTVMLNSRDEELGLLPEEFALSTEDNGENMFGNWSFTCAGAGLYGFESYCQYADEIILMQELAKGNVCGISVKYSPKRSDGYPVLDGSYGPTSGHLISIIGYEYEGEPGDPDSLYFYSSDSYSDADDTCYRRYSWKQLSRCWESRMAYIIPSQEPETGGSLPGIVRLPAQVEDLGGGEYVLKVDGSTVDAERLGSRGIVALCVPGVCTDMSGGGRQTDHSVVYPAPVQAYANNTFSYARMQADGRFAVNTQAMAAAAEAAGVREPFVEIFAISDCGYCYVAQLKL